MQITVKKLNGQEVRLEVSENDQISLVKRLVSEKFDVPVGQQRLVFKGKTLADSSILHEHQIVDGSKLHLSIRKPVDGASAENPDEFFGQLRELVKGHFSAQDTERVLAKFKEGSILAVVRSSETTTKSCGRVSKITNSSGGRDFKMWVWSLSLDDIERMAAQHMNESSDSI